MKRKKDKIFIIISSIFILSLISIYGYRFIHFYRLENTITKADTAVNEAISIHEHLMTYPLNQSQIDTNPNGLYMNDQVYYFKGQTTNNYLYYSGLLYRIVNIDANKKIKLITEDILTSLTYGENSKYDESYINKWLNKSYQKESGIFYRNLDEPSKYLTSTITCQDQIKDINNITCENQTNNNLISTISLSEYQLSGGIEGYLNNGTSFVTTNLKDDNNVWYILTDGEIASSNIKENHYLGIKAVITLNGDTMLLSGDGTKENPYYINDSEENLKLTTRKVGEYLKYSNYIWRIIGISDNNIKVAMEGTLKDVKQVFSQKNNIYSPTDKNSIGYYLNNDFKATLSNQDYLSEGPFYIGQMSIDNYDYTQIYEDKVKATVGLYQIGEPFINEYSSLTLSSIKDHTNKIIYTINNNQIYRSNISTLNPIRPVIYLDGDVLALSGLGTKDSPYIIGR